MDAPHMKQHNSSPVSTPETSVNVNISATSYNINTSSDKENATFLSSSSEFPASTTSMCTDINPDFTLSIRGFSNSLKSRLEESRSRLDEFVASQKYRADESQKVHADIVKSEQSKIDEMMNELKDIQNRRGLNMDSGKTRELPAPLLPERFPDDQNLEKENIAKQRMLLKQRQAEIEEDLANLRLDHSEKQRNMDEVIQQENIERENAEKVRKSKERVMRSKEITVDDLTYSVVKYKTLGLDFIKGDSGALKCNFTQIDPNEPKKVYSFLLNVNRDDDVYEVDDCRPELKAGELMSLSDELNSDEDFGKFIRGMRRAFKETLSP